MNDDFIILQAKPIKQFYCGTIKEEIERHSNRTSKYHQGMKLSYGCLGGGRNYEVHYPYVIDKNEWLSVMERYTKYITRGALIRNLYCNDSYIEDKEIDSDCKIYKGIVKAYEINKWFSRPFISLDDPSCTTNVFKKLEATFPDKSKWEH
jgi:hypothetical protein